tara:strand:- start:15 stop:1553 length:1539 start_codon:yes stop_codon:yes gene_type:complete
MIIVKRTDAANNWTCFHRSLASNGTGAWIELNNPDAAQTDPAVNYWNNTGPTDSVFTVATDSSVNASGGTYVAYIFAHNNNDGEFGPDSDQDIIKCGSYTGNGSTAGPEINLGFEPQWVMIKRTDASNDDAWPIHDTMRGIASGGADPYLLASSTAAENSISVIDVTSTGFKLTAGYGGWDGSGGTYIYMAIRRGPLAPPEAATEVFAVDNTGVNATTSTAVFSSGFPVDLGIRKRGDGGTNGDTFLGTRLLGSTFLVASKTEAETANGIFRVSGFQDGFGNHNGSGLNAVGWMWKRAPSYFDVVAYTGDSPSAGRAVPHNLTVAPEMIWVKNRNGASGGARPWIVYHKDTGNTGYLKLNETDALITSDPESKFGNGTAGVSPTDSNFTVAGDYEVNYSGDTYIAYLFASVAGISKVGSYTGNGSSQTIDCGFSNGARFVLIKRTDGTSDWCAFDSARGIVSGNSPMLKLNTGSGEIDDEDIVDPISSGFIVNSIENRINVSGATYIFYAIA